MWADKGSRPAAPKPGAFGNLHVLTAVCPATGKAEGLVAPVLNTGVVQSFLDQLSATIPTGTHVVRVWDGAGYHSAAKSLTAPANITLVTLPPYAPELNPSSGCGGISGSTTGRIGRTLTSPPWRKPLWPDGGPSV